MEKALIRGDYAETEFTSPGRFLKKYGSYHNLENNFIDLDGKNLAAIGYEGTGYRFYYENECLTIEKKGKAMIISIRNSCLSLQTEASFVQ